MPHTFVLVHGAWHGGWCWRRVTDRLERLEHKAYAPTLTGLADRSQHLTTEVGLSTHARDIADLVKWERLSDVVLVGHSYGGMVVTAAAELAGPAIGSLVMLDAFFPEAGQSLFDLAAPRTREMLSNARAAGQTTVPPIPSATLNVNEADRAWVDALCSPQPIATFTGSVSAAAVTARGRVPRKAYVRAAAYPSAPFDAGLAKAKATPGWRTFEIPCGHDVMVDMPDRLTEILIEVA